MRCLCTCWRQKDSRDLNVVDGHSRCSGLDFPLTASSHLKSEGIIKTSRRSYRPRPAIYYVRGSNVPVESLGVNSSRDSRCYYPPRRDCASTELGNPELVLLLNWQLLPPLSRLTVLQRAAHSYKHPILPSGRAAARQEGGDNRDRANGPVVEMPPAPAVSRHRMTEGDEAERPWPTTQVAQFPTGQRPTFFQQSTSEPTSLSSLQRPRSRSQNRRSNRQAVS